MQAHSFQASSFGPLPSIDGRQCVANSLGPRPVLNLCPEESQVASCRQWKHCITLHGGPFSLRFMAARLRCCSGWGDLLLIGDHLTMYVPDDELLYALKPAAPRWSLQMPSYGQDLAASDEHAPHPSPGFIKNNLKVR